MFPSLQAKLNRYEELELQLQDPEILADVQKMLEIQKEHGGLQKVALAVREFNDLESTIATTESMIQEESDAELKAYAQEELRDLQERFGELSAELEELVSAGDAITRGSLIMEIRAGTGGDEAALFALDLYEMYKRLIERRGWKYEVLENSSTDRGGIKEVKLVISGEGAFLQLQFESGGHRVQRVPETESQGRVHTSAATVAVMPEASEVEVELKSEDLDIATKRASGPGGQKVNKTESAVVITHLPTGIVVQCQDEKSQHKNKAKALRELRSRVLHRMQQEEHEKRSSHRRTLIGSGDRSERVRTYNFPQNRVTDHRIGLTLHKLEQIMQGDLDELIDAMLEFDRQERINRPAEEETVE